MYSIKYPDLETSSLFMGTMVPKDADSLGNLTLRSNDEVSDNMQDVRHVNLHENKIQKH